MSPGFKKSGVLFRPVSNLLNNRFYSDLNKITNNQEASTLMLVRHGITEWNDKKLWTGRYNIPISEEGEVQAKILGMKLKNNFFPDIAYTT